MSDNKFILQLKGTQTPKSVVEIKNDKLVTPFTGVPHSTDVVGSIIDDKDSSVVVAKGAQNWKLDGSSLVVASSLSGDGSDYTGEFNVSGNGLWINAVYSLPATIFSAGTKWALKLCGKNLLTTSGQTIGFTLIVKIGNTHITSKTFTVVEGANVFCRQLVIDFSESEQAIIKAQSGDSLTVQLLCSDANASATIYNGMTVFTALQRRVDADVVASDEKTFDEVVQDIDDINDEIDQINEDIDGLERYVDDTFVKKAGDTMSGALNIANIASSNTPLLTLTHSATATYKWNIAPRYNSTTLSIYPGSTETNGFRFATTGFVPASNNARYLGSASLKWKGVYTAMINNGGDLVVPAVSGTLATKADVDLAANSGRMITDKGVWYAKMNASTVPPAAEDGTNYADFSQVDGKSNPVIVIYNRIRGAWVQDRTITPPAEYDGYVPITSKIWDIAEQAGQQGGRVLWNHQSKEFTPYPQIVSFDGQNITNSTFSGGTITNSTFSGTATLSGASTVVMPQDPTGDQIVNKDYVDNAITNSGTGRNVGDIFLTMRNDNELNGAVECDGATYNTTDFTGAQSIGALLESGKIDYVSLSAYSTAISTKGWCDKIGWDGTGNTVFRVPTLNAHIVQTNNIPVVGNGILQGHYSGYTGEDKHVDVIPSGDTKPGRLAITDSSAWPSSAEGFIVSTDATKSGLIADTTDTAQLRVMIQLAVTATDEAVETCTAVTAQVAANTAAIAGADYVVESQLPTAQNNYTWYRKYKSGWVEQGGLTTIPSAKYIDITLPIPMQDNHYTPMVTASWSSSATGQNEGCDSAYKTNTTMRLAASYAGVIVWWQVSGMAAQ